MVAAAGGSMRAGAIRTHHHTEFPLGRLLDAKGTTTVSVCLPARNEAATIGPIVAEIRDELVVGGIVDELIVIDDHSHDATASIAADHGATVFSGESILPDYGEGHGKGEALWKSLLVSTGDVVVWCDTDLRDFHHRFVSGILGPLLSDPDVEFVKAFYDRPEANGEGGGRVTELVARPLIALLFPDLAGLRQPLSGEYGGRRRVLEKLPFVEGYGVEMGLLVDILRLRGTNGIAQVDLDVRHHRNRPLSDLGPQASAILQTVLRRVDRNLAPAVAELLAPGRQPVEIEVAERPPMIEVEDYLRRRSPSMVAGV
jgi:glucosyl-3-phosphoglycerate synthase